MTRDSLPTMLGIGTIAAVALVISGVPLATLVLPLVVLACPLMMIFMMRGLGHADGQGQGGHGAGCHGGHDERPGSDSSARPVGRDRGR